MTSIEELEKKIQKAKEIINDRIKSANTMKLPGKIEQIARNLGEYKDYGGGEYTYHEKGLSLKYDHHYNSVHVDLGYDAPEVFNAKPYQNGVGEIYLYIPGKWEQRIEELYNKISEVQKNKKTKSLQKEISALKNKWHLEEINH